MRRTNSFFSCSFKFLLTCLFLSSSSTGQPEKPNVLFIQADDLGWMNLGYMGSKFYETPNIDALAQKGMIFTQAYSANPLYSPTRASILTGLYPSRVGITLPHCHVPEEILDKQLIDSAPTDQKVLSARPLTRLHTEYYTMAEAFKENGYTTAQDGCFIRGVGGPYTRFKS